MAKKKEKNQSGPKFWLMRVRQIEVLHILVPNLGEIYLFGKRKQLFQQKLRSILRHGSQKTDLPVKNGILVKILAVKGKRV